MAYAKYIFLNIFNCKGIQDILKGLGTLSYLSVRSSVDCLLLSKMQEMIDTHVLTAEAERRMMESSIDGMEWHLKLIQ